MNKIQNQTIRTKAAGACLLLVLLTILLPGCAAWTVESGKTAAQFFTRDVARLGKPYVGRKITVKGTVVRVDVRNPEMAMVYLRDGVRCNFGRLKGMAEGCTPGREILVDGFLKHCEKNDILLDSAVLTTVAFTPKTSN